MKPVYLIWLLLVMGCGLFIDTNGQTQASDAQPEITAANPQSQQPATRTPAMTDIHDIKPTVAVADAKAWLFYLLAGLAALILLVLGFWLWRRKRHLQEEEHLEPPLPAEVIALEALKQLAADRKGLIDGQTFYFRLSAILRQYIDQRYNLSASKMTTEEFVPCVETLDLPLDLKRSLINLCQGTDPIKFAKASVNDLKVDADLRFVEDFVQQTTPHV